MERWAGELTGVWRNKWMDEYFSDVRGGQFANDNILILAPLSSERRVELRPIF